MTSSLQGQLSFYKITTRPYSSPIDQQLYENAYNFWKKIFSETFKVVIAKDYQLFSDEFLLQDSINVLLSGSAIIGLIAFLQLDLTSQVEIDRSYFKNYDSFALNKIRHEYNKVFIISNLAIDAQFRKSNSGKDFAFLLIGLGVLNFIHSEARALITITRNDRKTHERVLSFGGKSLGKHLVHGIESDIILINKDQAIAAFNQLPHSLSEELNTLFNISQINSKRHLNNNIAIK